jgi:hypothetical protein
MKCKWRFWGPCRNDGGESGYCGEHSRPCDVCGKPETGGCSHADSFACGAPVCGEHSLCRWHANVDGVRSKFYAKVDADAARCREWYENFEPEPHGPITSIDQLRQLITPPWKRKA